MKQSFREYIAERLAHTKELAREKRESEKEEGQMSLEELVREIFNEKKINKNEPYMNDDGEQLPF